MSENNANANVDVEDLLATEPALDDKGKSLVAAGFLGMLLDDLESRKLPTEIHVRTMNKAIKTCALALTEMKNFPDPLTEKEAKIFIKAFSLGTVAPH